MKTEISLEVFKYLALYLVQELSKYSESDLVCVYSLSIDAYIMSYDVAKVEWKGLRYDFLRQNSYLLFQSFDSRWRFLCELKRPLESNRWSTVKDAEKNAEFNFSRY